ncbi:hypothetical protein Franean1_1375 [Parafrankia sp. EAN1pec]|uniref:type III-D CRISPR-associated protein Csx19 n=1 Tax=Parafrankia sp. (strain EAN1pec) TaxID=298653 RepID=UPI0000540D1D|nr:hypothetical protein Franean1_1375 [Frankia sp. EAN1pec]
MTSGTLPDGTGSSGTVSIGAQPDSSVRLLVAHAPTSVTAQDVVALAGLLGQPCVGLLSSPTAHTVVRCHDGAAAAPDGPADLDGVFALRLFSPLGELRWLQTGGGRGTAVLLTETLPPPDGWPAHEEAVAAALDGRYALWGRRFVAHPDTAGWFRALEGRIGYLDVPAPTPASDPLPTGSQAGPPTEPGLWPAAYLQLRTREYLGRDDTGNAEVREERLLEITVADPEFGRSERTST